MRTLLCLSGLAAFAVACSASGDQVRPPDDQFYFPTGIEVAPDESVLFVVNANSDLRFDSGTLQVLELDKVSALASAWRTTGKVPAGGDCDQALDVPYTLVCNERRAVAAKATVRLGNFATEVRAQTLTDPAHLRLFVAVRGDPSLTWVDYDTAAVQLACAGGNSSYPECDDAHRLTQLRNDPSLLGIPDEPFGVYVDSAGGYAVITHLATGAVSLADAPPNGDPPVLSDAVGGLFQADPLTGVQGAVGVAGRQPGTPYDRVYVTSRSEARVQTLFIERPDRLPVLVPAEFFFIDRVQPSSDGRGIAFSADGDRSYIVNRNPPLLHIIDTSIDETGVPRNRFVGGVEICAEASGIAVADSGRGERVYVGCFGNGQVWVVDPAGGVIDAIIDTGRGPTALAASPTRHEVYVSNFLEDTVSVIDTEPDSATENRMVLKLGHPRQEGGK